MVKTDSLKGNINIQCMHKERLEFLSDGIFAIVMTILVIEIKVPTLEHIGPYDLWLQIKHLWPLFVSYLLSFSILFTYWRAHMFAFSMFAKNLDVNLVNLNSLFLFFITLIPFSSHLLGEYTLNQTAITFYAFNVIACGVSLYAIRVYVFWSHTIESEKISQKLRRNSRIRLLLPVVCAILSIIIGYYNPIISLWLFTFSIVFNLLPGGLDLLDWVWDRIRSVAHE